MKLLHEISFEGNCLTALYAKFVDVCSEVKCKSSVLIRRAAFALSTLCNIIIIIIIINLKVNIGVMLYTG